MFYNQSINKRLLENKALSQCERGAVVIAVTSRQCDPGSIPDLNEKQQYWLSSLLSSQKTAIPNSNSTVENEEPILRMCDH